MEGGKMYFVINKNPNYEQPYWWVIKSSGNNATLATSEMYAHKADCMKAIKLIKNADMYDRTGEV